jgi:hypothetical protein
VIVVVYKLLALGFCFRSVVVVGANGRGSGRGSKCGCLESAIMLRVWWGMFRGAVVSRVRTLRVFEM